MKRRSRRKAPAPGLTAMGDIAFLLITFFVLVSQMAQEDQMELRPPKSPDVHDLEAQAQARISVDSDERVYVDGDRVDLAGLAAVMSVRLPAPETAAPADGADTIKPPAPVAEGQDSNKPTWERLVLLRMDKETSYETYFEILETLAKLNAQVAIIADKDQ